MEDLPYTGDAHGAAARLRSLAAWGAQSVEDGGQAGDRLALRHQRILRNLLCLPISKRQDLQHLQLRAIRGRVRWLGLVDAR